MASLDPRKNESITNQANYLQTGTTTLLMASFTASIQSGVWNPIQYTILGSFWIIAAAYKQVKKVIDTWREIRLLSKSSSTPTS